MLIPNAAATAMPVVASLGDTAAWENVVEPFLPQLYELPSQIAAHITDPAGLKDVYLSTNPVVSGFAFSLALMPVFFAVSEFNRNYSQVDRVWSILPSVYHIHYAIWARANGLDTDKVFAVLTFSLIWTARLTFNYWRRGGYNIGSEDYRWDLIKGWIGQPAFFLLNVFFISSVQSILLFAVTTPSYLLLVTSLVEPKLTLIDQIFAAIPIGLIALEWFADGSQWYYHEAKNEYKKTGKVQTGYTKAQLERGFNTVGLFHYSRHPNFAAEQAIWVSLYVWGCVATKTYYNWTIVGPIQYLLIFAGSTPLTEYISSGKYPQYKLYQKRVGIFLPSIFGKGLDEKEFEAYAAAEVKKEKAKK